MNRPDYPYGFRVVGGVAGERQRVDAAAAFRAHCAADPKAQPGLEAYLSAFWFDKQFHEYVNAHGTTRGFTGSCWAPWLWLDIDRAGNPAAALTATKRLVAHIFMRFPALDVEDLLLFFSGGKGYHIGLPLAHNPDPGPDFHRIAGRLAAKLAEGAGVPIDTSLYDRLKLFRAPNSRHPVTKLVKRHLTHEELMHLSPPEIAVLAAEPAGFELPAAPKPDVLLTAAWAAAATTTVTARAVTTARPHTGRLQRETTDFLREGADEGERDNRLFRAAADLKELALTGGVDALIRAVLVEPARNSGLPPGQVERTITNGIAQAARKGNGREGEAK